MKKLLYALAVAAVLFLWLWKDSERLPFDIHIAEPRVQPDITALHPVLIQKKSELVQLAEAKGIRIVITDGFRSFEEQDALYAQGRSAEGAVVTKARGGESYHNYGLALDFALRTKDGGVTWEMNTDGNGNGAKDWMEVVGIAKKLGFEWGGDWPEFKDYPHLQMTFGYSIGELQRGKYSELVKASNGTNAASEGS
ncbi:M15 family metallopeptidase [Paenibacillus gansuensis]|uniref:M15 family metallopeptidase n=1 Tax=Paenibacillus gansuensis TaxID=306542 RepID=A0ABW5PFK5_9BACL